MHYKTIRISSTCRGKPPNARHETGSWLDDRMQSLLALEWPPGDEEELQPVPVQMQEGMYCARSGLGAGDGENGQADAIKRKWGDKPRWRHRNASGLRDAKYYARSTIPGLSGHGKRVGYRDGPDIPHPIIGIGTLKKPARDWISRTCSVRPNKIRDRDNDIPGAILKPPENRWDGRGVPGRRLKPPPGKLKGAWLLALPLFTKERMTIPLSLYYDINRNQRDFHPDPPPAKKDLNHHAEPGIQTPQGIEALSLSCHPECSEGSLTRLHEPKPLVALSGLGALVANERKMKNGNPKPGIQTPQGIKALSLEL